MNVRTAEAAGLRHKAKEALAGPQPAAAQQIINHNEKRRRAAVAASGEVDEPALLWNFKANFFEPFSHRLTKILR